MSYFYYLKMNIRALGFREVRITVNNCDDLCRTCNGPASTDCLSCYDTFIMDGGLCKCENDYYFDSADTTYNSKGACKKCPNYYGNYRGLSPVCFVVTCHYSWFQAITLFIYKV